MTKDASIRDKILGAALQIMQESGIKKLTQPKVAQAAGIRQSHLTYYYPRKIDLVVALLQGHLDQASRRPGNPEKPTRNDIGHALDTLTSDRRRMRFFLGLIIEAEQDPNLRKLVDRHITKFDELIADYFGRKAGDPDVEMFLNTLRGFGMRQLVRGGSKNFDVKALTRKFGLRVSQQRRRSTEVRN
ncbi:TetR/AcrR family transcriptional regulator [Bradyrhizobium sp. LjRoot220]|uniref:TetR/AcrR family transcriptional regulator n=1 Tax=Bradyrhizobium sp. LjRoot220 TaxID=3342284 RepID=UPI003ECC3FA5